MRGVPDGDYYIVVRHYNHLAVMSSGLCVLNGITPYSWDFTGSESQYYGSGGCALLEANTWGMLAGDSNGSGIVTNSDKDPIIGALNQVGYNDADINLSGIVTNADKDKIIENLNKASAVQ